MNHDTSPQNCTDVLSDEELERKADAGELLSHEELECLAALGHCWDCGKSLDAESNHCVCSDMGSPEDNNAQSSQDDPQAPPDDPTLPLTSDEREAQIRGFYRAITRAGEVREIRIVKPLDKRQGTISGYFDDEDAFVEAVMPFAMNHLAEAVYATVNAVTPALLARSPNELTRHAELTTADKDVVRRTAIFIDVDPVRPSGISATIEERDAAMKMTQAIMDYLTAQGCPDPIVNGSSDNGGMMLYRIDLPNDSSSKELVDGVLRHLAGQFNTDEVTVDATVSNAARIMKVPGTVAAKGKNTRDRPYRNAMVLTNPDAPSVIREQLEALVDTPPQEEAGDTGSGHSYGGSATAADEDVAAGIIRDVEEALKLRGIDFTKKDRDYGTTLDLGQCLTSEAHTRGASITILKNGRRAYTCHHETCRDQRWQDVAPLLGFSISQRAGGANQKKQFTIYDIDEFRRRPRSKYLIDGVIQERSLTMAYGGPGAYKTFVVGLGLGLSVAAGVSWHDFKTKQVPVLYIVGEGGGQFAKRIDAWLTFHGITEPLPFYILPDAPQLNTGRDLEATLDAVEALGVDFGLVIVDTLARTFWE